MYLLSYIQPEGEVLFFINYLLSSMHWRVFFVKIFFSYYMEAFVFSGHFDWCKREFSALIPGGIQDESP